MTTARRVLFAAAEAAPLAKAGGLADVVGSLPQALRERGVDVRIVLPYYRQIDAKKFGLRRRAIRFAVPFDGITHIVRLFETRLPHSRVPVYLLDHPHYEGAGDIYYQDVRNSAEQRVLQVERFLFFSRALPELLRALHWTPHVVHAHDWHAAAVPFLLRRVGTAALRRVATVYTIHNLPLQGSISQRRWLELFGRTEGGSLPNDALENGTVSLTALGLASADALTTVSPTYAREILRPSLGSGFHRLLRKRRNVLWGVLNGIDTARFDPAHDSAIIPYTAARLGGKEENARRLLARARLAPGRPVFGMVSRLTEQKGIELVCRILPQLVQWGCSAVILGSGEPELEERLRALAKRFSAHVSVTIGFDAEYAQQIYAGTDCFLMPSVFEPCGLGQMIAMRYGTIPIVRRTGGLADTVHEGRAGTGFVFSRFAIRDFRAACNRARMAFRDQDEWQKLQRRAMRQDFSWAASADQYLAVYQHAQKRHATK
ncbi:MAG: glycogen synthase [Candidatus Kerfeldbacteria bacterium]|nr:glycogen synthase [Candidatus Kerfeldbacteria bacterium]